MQIFGFVFFLLVFVVIGLLSTRRKPSDVQSDYLLAGRSVSPLLTALSAAATKNSGYMFIGLIGYIYANGLSAVWLVCGFLFGDLISFVIVPASLRRATERTGAMSFAQLISRWQGKDFHVVRIAIGVLTLVFLSVYAAAQFKAGGKALESLFGWHATSGALMGAGLILAYCMTGGLKASIWTDAAQSLLMLLAMILLLFSAISAAGGWSLFCGKVGAVSETYADLGPKTFGSVGATALFAFGWLFNGLGVTGQPQVMVRFMALDKPENIRKAGIYYFLWSSTFLSITFVVGLAARLYIAKDSGFDAELALPSLAQTLLPPLATGIVLGGIFAASLSTADSQVLSCSAVLTEDFQLAKKQRAKQVTTLLVVCVALVIALFAPANVFTLVILAWSALACSIGPLVIVQSLGGKPSQRTMLIMMFVGLATALLWRHYGLNKTVYEGAPGISAALLVFVISKLKKSTTT